jgi:hypothetical protein
MHKHPSGALLVAAGHAIDHVWEIEDRTTAAD